MSMSIIISIKPMGSMIKLAIAKFFFLDLRPKIPQISQTKKIITEFKSPVYFVAIDKTLAIIKTQTFVLISFFLFIKRIENN